MKSHFEITTYTRGPDKGLRKIVYINEKYKHRYLSAKKIWLSNTGYPELRELRIDQPLNPFRFLNDFLSLNRHAEVDRLFCRATQQTNKLSDHQVRAGLRSILTKNVYGVSFLRKLFKEFVIACEFVDPERN